MPSRHIGTTGRIGPRAKALGPISILLCQYDLKAQQRRVIISNYNYYNIEMYFHSNCSLILLIFVSKSNKRVFYELLIKITII